MYSSRAGPTQDLALPSSGQSLAQSSGHNGFPETMTSFWELASPATGPRVPRTPTPKPLNPWHPELTKEQLL